MKRIISIFSMLSISIALYSQNVVSEIKIGDKVPDIVFNNVINYTSKKIRLSDYKGRFVLLSFWKISCSGCIGTFPEMQNLQNKFGDKIQIFLVNSTSAEKESEEAVKKLLNRIKEKKGFYPELPMPLHDTILEKYFPKLGVPHEVWINQDGILVAVTGSSFVTEKNISAVLAGHKVSMLKKDTLRYDSKKLFVDENGKESKSFLHRSILTGFRPEYGAYHNFKVDENQKTSGMYFINYPLRTLIYYAYNIQIPGSRVLYEVNNPDRFKGGMNDVANLFCYDISISPSDSGFYKIMPYLRDDLKRALNITVTSEKRKMKTFVFTSHKDVSQIKTRYSKPDWQADAMNIKKYYHNIKFEDLWREFEGRIQFPIINETGIVEAVDLDFPDKFDLHNSEAMIDFLKKSGYSIKEEEREIDVLVVRD